MEQKLKKILVVRNDRFGEFILNIPALRALKETFAASRIIAVVDPAAGELAGHIPFVDEIIEWGSREHSLLAKFRFIGLLKEKNIDAAVMLNPSKDFNIFTYLAGIPIRVGYNRKLGFLLTHKMQDEKSRGGKHEIEYNLELVRLIGAQTQDKSLSLPLGTNMVDTAAKELGLEGSQNLVAIHPWTSDAVKQWPLGYFRILAERLAGEPGLKLVIVGAKDEIRKSRELFTDSVNLTNLTGKTTLIQLAAILKMSQLLISGDSGPVHLSCAVGTPVIAIFRNDIPGKGAKRWGPWGDSHTVIEKSNLCDITPDEVFDRIKERLGRQ